MSRYITISISKEVESSFITEEALKYNMKLIPMKSYNNMQCYCVQWMNSKFYSDFGEAIDRSPYAMQTTAKTINNSSISDPNFTDKFKRLLDFIIDEKIKETQTNIYNFYNFYKSISMKIPGVKISMLLHCFKGTINEEDICIKDFNQAFLFEHNLRNILLNAHEDVLYSIK